MSFHWRLRLLRPQRVSIRLYGCDIAEVHAREFAIATLKDGDPVALVASEMISKAFVRRRPVGPCRPPCAKLCCALSVRGTRRADSRHSERRWQKENELENRNAAVGMFAVVDSAGTAGQAGGERDGVVSLRSPAERLQPRSPGSVFTAHMIVGS